MSTQVIIPSKHPTLAVSSSEDTFKRILLFCFSNLDTSELCGMYITLYDLHVTFFSKFQLIN